MTVEVILTTFELSESAHTIGVTVEVILTITIVIVKIPLVIPLRYYSDNVVIFVFIQCRAL